MALTRGRKGKGGLVIIVTSFIEKRENKPKRNLEDVLPLGGRLGIGHEQGSTNCSSFKIRKYFIHRLRKIPCSIRHFRLLML